MTEQDWSSYKLWHGVYGEPSVVPQIFLDPVLREFHGDRLVATFPNGARFQVALIPRYVPHITRDMKLPPRHNAYHPIARLWSDWERQECRADLWEKVFGYRPLTPKDICEAYEMLTGEPLFDKSGGWAVMNDGVYRTGNNLVSWCLTPDLSGYNAWVFVTVDENFRKTVTECLTTLDGKVCFPTQPSPQPPQASESDDSPQGGP